ncbi:other/FunK1 protein kinase [Pseudozyma hubeiensis SY62]|uniref:Other/FunK1 protein kinase n=1 Tax=Pseudozyma hubeiensis (strain SY62) TaxID=1305764 RepID=R9NY24_PSEHS|nr:other/FunK1 protein kinase [Pseudozyma hubeiensis SY62]GAC93648.1 other/FunK1 protein kinase [Pseudozyma hubeiensis SY62]
MHQYRIGQCRRRNGSSVGALGKCELATHLLVEGKGNVSQRVGDCGLAKPLFHVVIGLSLDVVFVAGVIDSNFGGARGGDGFVRRVLLERVMAEKLIAYHCRTLGERAGISGVSTVAISFVPDHLALDVIRACLRLGRDWQCCVRTLEGQSDSR